MGAIMFEWSAAAAQYGSDVARTYYISPVGNDRNNGLSPNQPWLTPNHPISCGDTIVAAAGSYRSDHFVNGHWGTVSHCPSRSGIYFARLLCAGPYVSSCSITDETSNAMWLDRSNWAVSGWTASSTTGACFEAVPSGSYNIHYVAFINVVANGCKNGGIEAYRYYGANQYGIDEFAVVGAIIHAAAGGGSECFSGLSVYEPVNVDYDQGTHIFVAGVFSIGNIDPNPCAGGAPTDGEGFIFDTFDGNGYTGRSVIEQSMALGNGSAGFEIFADTAAPAFILSSTAWGDFRDASHVMGGGELFCNASTAAIFVTKNIFEATKSMLNGSSVYGAYVYGGNSRTVISRDNIYGVTGNNINTGASIGVTLARNIYAMANFVNPIIPGAPNCSRVATTTACMKETIADFVPRAAAALALGYKAPGPCTADPYFPIWLKGMVPNGLITKPCGV